jgi:hypothetical protein
MLAIPLPADYLETMMGTGTTKDQRLLFDLALAFTWKYDLEFMEWIEEEAQRIGLTTYRVEQHNVEETLELLRRRMLWFRCVLDRASDECERFHPFAQTVERLSQRQDLEPTLRVLNPRHLMLRASDKATMHLEFLERGIGVPYTLIVSPFNTKREVELSLSELARLGRPFIIKPANTTGGGVGVVTGAESLKDVLEARQHHKNDKYLLQETVRPAVLAGKRAWFRTFFAFDTVHLCWWDDQTHLYEEVDPEQERTLGLSRLRDVTREIREVCRLDFFSSEIVLTPAQTFVVVDYVNEMCDMRPQSSHPDGVPDTVVRAIVRALTASVARTNARRESA